MDYMEISSTEEVPKGKELKMHKKRDSVSARQHSHDKGIVKSDGSGAVPSHGISPGAFKHSVPIPPPSVPAKSKKSNKEKNRKQRVRRKQHRLENRLRLSGHQPDISAEYPVQQMTSPTQPSGPARTDEEESGSFTAKIRELECANHRMKNELGRSSIHLQESLDENRTLHAKIRRLQDELDSSSSRATHLEDELVRATNGITEAMQVLQDHQTQERSRPNLHGCRQGESGDSTADFQLPAQ
ncbi:hypothetical protein N7485_005098 [Penicillium canescens]|nr:hypothetical protein N7485_005098 [Penicillium canescens]